MFRVTLHRRRNTKPRTGALRADVQLLHVHAGTDLSSVSVPLRKWRRTARTPAMAPRCVASSGTAAASACFVLLLALITSGELRHTADTAAFVQVANFMVVRCMKAHRARDVADM